MASIVSVGSVLWWVACRWDPWGLESEWYVWVSCASLVWVILRWRMEVHFERLRSEGTLTRVLLESSRGWWTLISLLLKPLYKSLMVGVLSVWCFLGPYGVPPTLLASGLSFMDWRVIQGCHVCVVGCVWVGLMGLSVWGQEGLRQASLKTPHSVSSSFLHRGGRGFGSEPWILEGLFCLPFFLASLVFCLEGQGVVEGHFLMWKMGWCLLFLLIGAGGYLLPHLFQTLKN